jgi:CBS domain-containing protein
MIEPGTTPVGPRAFLSRHAPFDTFSAPALDRIERVLEMRFAARGETIFARDSAPVDALWIVRKGRVRLELDGELLEVVEPGECFGFPSLIAGRPPERDAVASEDALLFRVPKAEFQRLLDEPGAARFFLEGLAARLRLQSASAEGGSRSTFAKARDLGRRPLATIHPGASVEEAARRMRDLGVGSLLVTREPHPPADGVTELPLAAVLGIVTDRDLRDRVLAAGLSTATAVGEIVSAPLLSIGAGASNVDALLELARHGVRHLPLVAADRIVGFVSASDLVLHQSLHPLALRRELDRRPLVDLLPGFTGRLRRVVAELAASGVDAVRIGPIVSTLADRLARRLVEESSRRRGSGDEQVAWMVHGSEGRQEQILPTDQDNALVWQPAGGGADPEGAVAQQVERVAQQVVAGLLAAGYPVCPGGYMATHWHDPMAGWIRRFERWIAEPREEDGIDIHTFLDLRVVAGGLDVAPLDELRRVAGEDRHFLRALAREVSGWALPFGLFGTLKEGEEGFDLKRGSLLIVAIARLSALEAGSRARGTIDRLAAAEPVLGEDAATLAEGFRYLAGLRLELALDPGRRADSDSGHRIHLAALNALERRFLKDIFTLLRNVRDGLVARFAL